MKTCTYTEAETHIRCVYIGHGQVLSKTLRLAKTGQVQGTPKPRDSPQVIRLVRFIRYAEELQLIATWPWQRLTSSGVDC